METPTTSNAPQLVGVIAVGAFLAIFNHPIILTLIVIAFLDLATGIFKGWLCYRVESHIMAKGIWRLVAYVSIAALFIAIGKLDTSLLVLTNSLLALFTLREAVSVAENFSVISKVLKVDIPGLAVIIKVLRINVKKLEDEASDKGTH